MGNCLTIKGEETIAYHSHVWPLRQPTPGEVGNDGGENISLPEGLAECISLFKEIKDRCDIDQLINMIQQLLQRKMSKQQNNPENASTSSQEESSMWTSITNSGSKFLSYLNDFGSSEALHQGIKLAAKTLEQAGQINSIVGGLSTIASVLSKFEIMRDNQSECLELLRDMIDLARHLKTLKKMIPEEEEKFTKGIQMIVEESISCICQLESNMLFRFMKTSVNSDYLSNLRRKINELYPELMLTAITDMRKDIPSYLPITQPVYPEETVGVEEQVNEIVDLLTTTDQSSLAVIIYGFGGIGKTTIAEAVVSKIDLNNYNYTSVEIYQEQEKNDFKRSQQQILKDCFPEYNGGKLIMVRDCKDGRCQLMEAFKCEKNKAVFLFIDNALRSADLKELLPQDLGGLPQGSRILITTRLLAATNMFEGQPSLVRKPYSLKTLPDEDASKILFKDPSKRGTIKNEDLKRILKICSGVPLALKIVGAQLQQQGYQVDKCDDLLKNLEKGVTIKDENLSKCLVNLVYDKLEEYIQEAFLDICCFFSKWKRQDVEYIVGASAVTSLFEAGLITSTAQHDHCNAIFSYDDEFIVHDIIRKRGQSLANGNRIMDVQSLSEAADEEKLNQIKGVWLVEDMSEYVIEEKHLSSMRKSVRVLALGDRMKVSRVSEKKFEELRFLGVGGDIPELPVKVEMLDKLRVFHGPFFIEDEASLYKLPKSLLAMKVKDKSHPIEYTNSEMARAIRCLSLEKLDFTGLLKPPKLPDGFNQLLALRFLILDNCSEMQELPEQMCHLPALSVLSMKMCPHLKCLPQSFGQLSSLTQLDLYGCVRLKQLPSTVAQLTALRNLNITWTGLKRKVVESQVIKQVLIIKKKERVWHI